MPNISSSVTNYLLGLLQSDDGFGGGLTEVSGGEGDCSERMARSVIVQNASPDLLERSQQVQYPAVYIYCDRLNNTLKEKFATFSGQARLVVEVRCSGDRIEGLEEQLNRHVDAACGILDNARGTWQDGAFFTGGYEVAYGAVRHGGKNFIQIAKISFEVQVSK